MRGWPASRDPAWAQGALRPQVAPPDSAGESTSLLSPPSVVATLALALRRAFRLTIDPAEVTGAERAALELASPPVADPIMQGFLTWRRSVHLVVAVAIVPLLMIQIVELADTKGIPGAATALLVIQLLIDVGFTVLLWAQLGNWTQWQAQRRMLAAGWLAFFVLPFLLFLYPLRSAMDDAVARQAVDPAAVQAGALAYGLAASVLAMIQLAPKAISLVPGLLRGAITSKLLFPGSSSPGWLMLLLAPIEALLVYVVLVVPYQISGSGFFVAAMIGLIGAQVLLGRMGYQFARPERLDEVLAVVGKVRVTYLALNLLSVLFVAFGLVDLLKQVQLSMWSGLQIFLSLLVNVLLLTLIATDQIVAHLVRAQKLLAVPGAVEAQAALAGDLARFDDGEPDPR